MKREKVISESELSDIPDDDEPLSPRPNPKAQARRSKQRTEGASNSSLEESSDGFVKDESAAESDDLEAQISNVYNLHREQQKEKTNRASRPETASRLRPESSTTRSGDDVSMAEDRQRREDAQPPLFVQEQKPQPVVNNNNQNQNQNSSNSNSKPSAGSYPTANAASSGSSSGGGGGHANSNAYPNANVPSSSSSSAAAARSRDKDNTRDRDSDPRSYTSHVSVGGGANASSGTAARSHSQQQQQQQEQARQQQAQQQPQQQAARPKVDLSGRIMPPNSSTYASRDAGNGSGNGNTNSSSMPTRPMSSISAVSSISGRPLSSRSAISQIAESVGDDIDPVEKSNLRLQMELVRENMVRKERMKAVALERRRTEWETLKKLEQINEWTAALGEERTYRAFKSTEKGAEMKVHVYENQMKIRELTIEMFEKRWLRIKLAYDERIGVPRQVAQRQILLQQQSQGVQPTQQFRQLQQQQQSQQSTSMQAPGSPGGAYGSISARDIVPHPPAMPPQPKISAEENREQSKREIRNILLETVQLISKLQSQVDILKKKGGKFSPYST